jgi:hypothetical protein
VWSWDITYLPTTVRGIWLYLYLVIDVCIRKVVAWDVDEREDPGIAADLVSRACLRERISKRRRQPLILHADNGNAMRAATLESRLEELGVLRLSHGHECPTTIPTPNRCSERLSIGPITPASLLLPKSSRASGSRRSSTGITTKTVTAASNS